MQSWQGKARNTPNEPDKPKGVILWAASTNVVAPTGSNTIETGKPHRESTKSEKEADAKRLLKRREGEIAQGKLPGVYLERALYDELAKDLINDYRINNKSSLARAEASRAHLDKFFEATRIIDISTSRVREYIAKVDSRSRRKCNHQPGSSRRSSAC